MFSELPLLSLVIWLPFVGGLIVLAAANAGHGLVRWLALAVALLTFAVSLPLYTLFDAASVKMQFEELAPWIRAFIFNYLLGIDGISLLLILLTTFTTVLVIISAWEVIQYKVAQYLAAFLIMEGLMVGVFAALDAALFYVFWEAMLIPMFLIIGVWGGCAGFTRPSSSSSIPFWARCSWRRSCGSSAPTASCASCCRSRPMPPRTSTGW